MRKDNEIARALSDGLGHMAFLGLLTAAERYRHAQSEYAKEAGKGRRRGVLLAWSEDVKWYAKTADRNAWLLARWLSQGPGNLDREAAALGVLYWSEMRGAWAAAQTTKWKDKAAVEALRGLEKRLDDFLKQQKLSYAIIGSGPAVQGDTTGSSGDVQKPGEEAATDGPT